MRRSGQDQRRGDERGSAGVRPAGRVSLLRHHEVRLICLGITCRTLAYALALATLWNVIWLQVLGGDPSAMVSFPAVLVTIQIQIVAITLYVGEFVFGGPR